MIKGCNVVGALWTVACLGVLGALSACGNTEMYCYRGHDETYTATDGGHWTQRVCDEYRNTYPDAKYPAEASDAAAR